MFLKPKISQPKLGQIVHVGGVLKKSGTADFKSVPGFENWQRFVGVIEQNKLCNSFCQYCISISFLPIFGCFNLGRLDKFRVKIQRVAMGGRIECSYFRRCWTR